MKYRDLIQFDPIESVVQLGTAERADEAERLVSSYVISEKMAERLTEVAIRQLQFRRPADQKGLLVVGNYGTGKSHLLAVISSVAEREDLAERLRSESVRSAATEIAGQFKVVRMEIGATEMGLRDIIAGLLQEALASWGIEYRFPPMTEASNTKEPLLRMMEAFQERFPEQGLLLVVDELLDYLRTRDEQEVILDLNFLREVGEVCGGSRFRFIGGLQESLFDTPRFQFVAQSLRRVRARFEQVQIAREDVAYVVAERLLRKTPEQRVRVRNYLQPFAALYPPMSERLDAFVNLFPVHPAYIRTFQAITAVEKREVLRTLSREMQARLDHDLPEEYPGLITYDSYWEVLRNDAVVRTTPDVGEVLDKSRVLEEKIESGYTRPAYKPVARRIIHALSVYRLATDDLKAQLGVTPAELRDDLCLYLPMPEVDPEFLASTVEVAIKEISRTVNGQYISVNPENGQWYLDLSKDIDYDALIAERAATLSPDQLDRYFYDALSRLLELADVDAHVSGYRIWQYEADWPEKKVTRPGYIFLGAPNQRSTAQPPREFYLYFLQPYDPPAFDDEQKPDEVFFRLARKDAAFDEALRLYGGAMVQGESASTAHRAVYRAKASSTNPQSPGYLQQIMGWLRENAASALDVTYAGVTRPAAELLQGRVESIRDLVDSVASTCLAPQFRDTLPEYPAFPARITNDNRPRAATEAIRWIGGPLKTRAGAEVLTGLRLLQGDKLSVDASPYARWIRDELAKRGEGQVVNRSDLIESLYGGSVERDVRFGLEKEWIAVVLVALAYAGEIAVAAPGLKLDAGNIEQASRTSIDTLAAFQYIERPRAMPTVALTALFEMLGLQSALVKDPATHAQAVRALQTGVQGELGRVLKLRKQVTDGVLCWNENVLGGAERTNALAHLDPYKAFLDDASSINTPGRLKNFRPTAQEVWVHGPARDLMAALDNLLGLVAELQPLASYLLQAQAMLPQDHAIAREISDAAQRQLNVLRDPQARTDGGVRESCLQEARRLKDEYIEEYARLHARARLTIDDDHRKGRLLRSPEMTRLNALRKVKLFSGGAFAEIERGLDTTRVCAGFSPASLQNQPRCSCGFRPDEAGGEGSAAQRLDRLEERVYELERDWAATLVLNLKDPTVEGTLGNLGPSERRPLDTFMQTGRLPDHVGADFIRALDLAFTGIERITIPKLMFVNRLTGNGAPSTRDEFVQRLDVLLGEFLRGKDPAKVRIVVEGSDRTFSQVTVAAQQEEVRV